MCEFETESTLSIYGHINSGGAFPTTEVEDCIREALDAEESAQQILRSRPPSACEPAIDSLVVIEVICAIEELLGVTLPTSFAPRGGYNDIEACVSDLGTQARAVWNEIVKQKEEHHA